MKTIYKMFALCAFVLLCQPVCLTRALSPDVNQIVKAANHAALYQGSDCKGKIDLTITDKQKRVRKRSINILRKNSDELDQDQKYFAYFQSPADVRKMVFMVHKNAATGTDDDRWLYMPSLDLVKRIAASDKRTSFAGSDFLYEDISGRSLEADTHELVKTTDQFFVVKNTPKKPELVEFLDYTAFIDKTTFIPMRVEYYKKGGILYRVMEVNEVTPISAEKNGKKVTYPTVTRSTTKNLESASSSVMVFSKIKYNNGIEDELFTERYLRRPPRMAMR